MTEQIDMNEVRIHEITSLLARRVVCETSKHGFSGEAVVKYNREADKELIALIEQLEGKVREVTFHMNFQTEVVNELKGKLEQAKQEVAREIFREIELSDFYDGEDDVGISIEKPIYERLKSRYLGEGGGE